MSGSAKVGWSAKEIVWLRAALTLPGLECLCALDDIASMSCRTISAVKSKAQSLKVPPDAAPPRRVMVPAAARWAPIKQPTKAQLMAGRAR